MMVVAPSAAFAVSHTNELRVNMENYRVCVDPKLGTCLYDDQRSPSEYHIPHGNKVSVYIKSDGKVDIRSDTLAIDSGLTFTCAVEGYRCVGGACEDGPDQGDPCSADECFGGSNDGAPCSVDSECPGGLCAGDTCFSNTCQGGPLDDTECINASTDCNDFVNNLTSEISTGWHVVFRGNTEVQEIVSINNTLFHIRELQGGSTSLGDGCVMTCPFAVDNAGEDQANITCSTAGDCSNVRAFHSIELVDPAGHVVAVPTLGTATIAGATGSIGSPGDPGDPAKFGDACRTEDPPPGDCE
jgi:hypothetical protein